MSGPGTREVSVCPSCGSDEVLTEAEVGVNDNVVHGWCDGGDFRCGSCGESFRDANVEHRPALVPAPVPAEPWWIDEAPAELVEARRSNRRVAVRDENRLLVGRLLVHDAERVVALTGRALAPSDEVLELLASLVMAERENIAGCNDAAVPDGGEEVRWAAEALLDEAERFLAAVRVAR